MSSEIYQTLQGHQSFCFESCQLGFAKGLAKAKCGGVDRGIKCHVLSIFSYPIQLCYFLNNAIFNMFYLIGVICAQTKKRSLSRRNYEEFYLLEESYFNQDSHFIMEILCRHGNLFQTGNPVSTRNRRRKSQILIQLGELVAAQIKAQSMDFLADFGVHNSRENRSKSNSEINRRMWKNQEDKNQKIKEGESHSTQKRIPPILWLSLV